MKNLSPVDYATPFFILLILLEMAWARRRAPNEYEAKDTLISLTMGLGSTVVNALTAGLVTAWAFWLYSFRPIEIGWQWWAWAACFVLDDFNYYLALESATAAAGSGPATSTTIRASTTTSRPRCARPGPGSRRCPSPFASGRR